MLAGGPNLTIGSIACARDGGQGRGGQARAVSIHFEHLLAAVRGIADQALAHGIDQKIEKLQRHDLRRISESIMLME